MAQAPPKYLGGSPGDTSHIERRDPKKKVTASDKGTSEPRILITAIIYRALLPSNVPQALPPPYLPLLVSYTDLKAAYPDLGPSSLEQELLICWSKDRERRKPRGRQLLGACRNSSNRPHQRFKTVDKTTSSSLKPPPPPKKNNSNQCQNHLVAVASRPCPPSSLCAQSGRHRYNSAPPSSHYSVGWPVPGLLVETSPTTSSHLKNSQRPSKRLLRRPPRRNPV